MKRKQQQLIEYVEKLPIIIHQIPREELRRKACKAYDEWPGSIEDRRGSGAIAGRYSPEDFLLHIECNYVRHNLTQYKHHLNETVSRVGLNSAYQIIHRRVYEAIAEVYPHVRDECARQLDPNQQAHRFRERPWRSSFKA